MPINNTATHICTVCHSSFTQPTTHTRGSTWITVLLLLCWIIPGVIYWLWRRSTRTKVCPQCEAREIVPLASPRGFALYNAIAEEDRAESLERQARLQARRAQKAANA